MTPETAEGSADGPDVAALTDAERSCGERKAFSDLLWFSERDVERILADRLAAVTAQRDQYAAQVAADALDELQRRAVEAGVYIVPEDDPYLVGLHEGGMAVCNLAADLRASLRADGGGSQ